MDAHTNRVGASPTWEGPNVWKPKSQTEAHLAKILQGQRKSFKG